MKYLIASDVHGSSYYCKKIVEIFEREKADKLILLGDIYNHGPRNSLPKDYDPIEVSNTLNAVIDKLIVIKGNCDSEVDSMISKFDFLPNLVLAISGKTFFLTHGHIFNKDNLPKTKFSGIIYGHFHTGFIEKKGETFFINVGSTSLPKNGTPNSYLILDHEKVILKDLNENIIKQENI